jgi:hypothetical protein
MSERLTRRGWSIVEEENSSHQASGPSSRIASLASNRFIGPVLPPETAGGASPIPHPFVIQSMRIVGADGRVVKEINHLEWPKYGWEVKP